MERIAEIIRKIEELDDILVHESLGSAPMPVVWRSTTEPAISWHKEEFERSLGIALPADIVELWTEVSSLRLFEDVNYGQWGTIIWSPIEAVKPHPSLTEYRREDFEMGDLIIGKCRGDSDLIVLRCAPLAADFGEVLVALPISPRNEWPRAAVSLAEFLEKLLDAKGLKFWD